MSSIHLHLLLIAILTTILIAPTRAAENCRYSKIDARTYSEIQCQDLRAFPTFENLTDGSVNGEITVRKLYIGGDFALFPQNGLEKFKHIEKLILDLSNPELKIESSNTLDYGYVLTNCSIDELTLKDRAALKWLPLNDAIHPDTIANLTGLIIEDSNIILDDRTFEGASSLRYLAMRVRRPEVLAFGTKARNPFKPFASTLTELDLSHNEITLNTDWIRTVQVLTNLKILRLNDNKIDAIPMELDITTLYPQLQILDLSGNHELKRVDFKLKLLEELKLDYCQFDELPIESLRNSSLLKTFSIKGNRLENLRENSFATNPFLEYLNLDENPLRNLEMGSFRGQIGMRNFMIRDWDVDRLDLSVFVNDMTELEVLGVVENQNLESIFISNNRSINLKYLDIRNNSLHELDESLDRFLLANDQLRVHILEETHFKCPMIDQDMENSTIDHDNSTMRNFTMHPWMWLAVQYKCRQKVLIDDDVFCEQRGKGNQTKLNEYLTDLHPNCTGIDGTTARPPWTTMPASPTTGGPLVPTTSSASQLRQQYGLIFSVLTAMFLGFAMK